MKKLAVICSSIVLVTFGSVGMAQVGKPGMPGQVSSMGTSPLGEKAADGQGETIHTKLKTIDNQLTKIELLFEQIEAAKETAAKDRYADDLEKSLTGYTKAMMESYDTVLQQAEIAHRSQGKEGNVAQIKAFEDLATRHEERLKVLDQRGKKITVSASPSAVWEPTYRLTARWSLQVLENISDVLISPAQAAIALSVYNACNHPSGQIWTQAQQAACAKAILKGNSDRITAQNTFTSCWNSNEGTRPKWLRAIRRTGCATALVIRLA
jgi:hypothetical protein